MSKIFELFGYRLDAWGSEAEENCKRAWCPFMNAECDGGGNRYLSAINLKENSKLQDYFSVKDVVQAGICSLVIRQNEQPWIVCPRRLLTMRNNTDNKYQQYVRAQALKLMEIPSTDNFRVWSEVKMKVNATTDDEQEKSFDYTFDYIIAGKRKVKLSEASKIIGKSEKQTKKIAENNGFTVSSHGELWIDDFPSDPMVIIEIMTSSTSGGDKKKRTQIGMAFEDAILHGNNHNGPSINYRQVWARMVSQLIVKSQIGSIWGGKTIWIIQDVLADYISNSTALNLSKYLSEKSNEVNILAFSYGNQLSSLNKDEIVTIRDSNFYSGPIMTSMIGTEDNNRSGFIDIVKIGAPPPKDYLWRALFIKGPCAVLS